LTTQAAKKCVRAVGVACVSGRQINRTGDRISGIAAFKEPRKKVL